MQDPSKFVVIVVAALVVESGAHVAAKEEEKKEEAAKEPDDGIAHPLGIWFRFCKNIWVVSFCLYLYPPCASYLNGAYYLYIIEVNGNIC